MNNYYLFGEECFDKRDQIIQYAQKKCSFYSDYDLKFKDFKIISKNKMLFAAANKISLWKKTSHQILNENCSAQFSKKKYPSKIAENLQRQGGYIPGIRPGKNTSEYFLVDTGVPFLLILLSTLVSLILLGVQNCIQ